jgi:hypothetical protein
VAKTCFVVAAIKELSIASALGVARSSSAPKPTFWGNGGLWREAAVRRVCDLRGSRNQAAATNRPARHRRRASYLAQAIAREPPRVAATLPPFWQRHSMLTSHRDEFGVVRSVHRRLTHTQLHEPDQGERHEPSYRFVTPLDVLSLPTFN